MRLGDIGGCPFYMSAARFSTGNARAAFDVVPGRGMFSLEGQKDCALIRCLFDEEQAALIPPKRLVPCPSI